MLSLKNQALVEARHALGFSRTTFREFLARESGVSADTFLPPEIARREEFGDLLNAYGLLGEAVEVGTHRATFAAQILSRWQGRRLTCVDPWVSNMPDYNDPTNGSDRENDERIAREVLGQFGDRTRILKMTSEEAAPLIEDASLDFVYVDGNHHTPYVRQDIALWWPKVRPGGILAGHDIICQGELHNGWGKFVMPVVGRFAADRGLSVHLVPRSYWSWYIHKPAA